MRPEPLHAETGAPRPSALSWPAALLPGALLLTLLSVGTVGSTSSDKPVTDLHVVVGDGQDDSTSDR